MIMTIRVELTAIYDFSRIRFSCRPVFASCNVTPEFCREMTHFFGLFLSSKGSFFFRSIFPYQDRVKQVPVDAFSWRVFFYPCVKSTEHRWRIRAGFAYVRQTCSDDIDQTWTVVTFTDSFVKLGFVPCSVSYPRQRKQRRKISNHGKTETIELNWLSLWTAKLYWNITRTLVDRSIFMEIKPTEQI